MNLLKFNLMPVVEKKNKISFEPIKIFSLLLIILFAVGYSGTLGYSLYQLKDLNTRIQDKDNEKMELLAQLAVATRHLKELDEIEGRLQIVLSMKQLSAPALELLSSIEGALPDGVWIETLSLQKSGATMSGFAFSYPDVAALADGLRSSSVVMAVNMPQANSISKNGENLIGFTLVLTFKQES